MTFHELCSTFNVSPAEREQLAWFLAQFRARKTYEELRSEYGPNNQRLLDVLRQSMK